MGRRSEVPAIAALLLAALLAGCSEPTDQISGEWEPVKVASMDLSNGFPTAKAELELKDGEYTGFDGCNEGLEYTGTYELDGDSFSSSPDQQNQVGTDCGLGLLNWFEVLGSAATADVNGEGLLVFTDADGETVATLKPARSS